MMMMMIAVYCIGLKWKWNTVPRKILYSLHFTPPHSPCRHLLATDALQTSRWLSCGWCQLLSDRYHIGCHNEKISPCNNTIQNLWISNNSVVLTCLYLCEVDPRSTQPSIPPVNRVPACMAGVKAGCAHLCWVAGNTVW